MIHFYKRRLFAFSLEAVLHQGSLKHIGRAIGSSNWDYIARDTSTRRLCVWPCTPSSHIVLYELDFIETYIA